MCRPSNLDSRNLLGLKKPYDQQPPNTDGPVYRFDSAIDLSKKLVYRASSGLNQRMYDESARLKACPEAAFWIGIPVSLVPANIKAFNLQSPATESQAAQSVRKQTSHPTTAQNAIIPNGYPDNTASTSTYAPVNILQNAPDALVSDVVQIAAPTRPRQGLNYVSPLESVAPNANQFFSSNWGQSARNSQTRRKQQKGGRGRRSNSNPYQRENVAPTRLTPLMATAPVNLNNQSAPPTSARQGNNQRRWGNRTPNTGPAIQSVNLSHQEICFLQNLLKDLGR